MFNYTPKLHASSLSFEKIMDEVNVDVGQLSNKEQEALKEQLKHGAGRLTTKLQLKMYLRCYGEMHQAKLIRCYNNIPSKIWREEYISIIDYGSGQGLAEIVLADYLKSKWIDNDFVKDIILIDPSRVSLVQGVEYLSKIFTNSEIIPVLKNDVQIDAEDLNPKSKTIIHILSNVIDLDDFQGYKILSLLNEDTEHNNIVICVSPYYQEISRGRKIDEFGSKLQGYNCVYKFQKHIDEWKENYSCQIRIYKSMYY